MLNLDFANNTILSCSFFVFLLYWLYFLIPPVIIQIFNHIEEFVIPIGTTIKEAKAEMETHPVTFETNINKCSIEFKNL